MSDWQVGDLALCVGYRGPDGWRDFNAPRPARNGMIYQVQLVMIAPGWTALVLDGAQSTWTNGAYNARSFRKIPPHEADAFDCEVIDLLNRKLVEA